MKQNQENRIPVTKKKTSALSTTALFCFVWFMLFSIPSVAQPQMDIFSMSGIARPAAQSERIPNAALRVRVVADAFDHPLAQVKLVLVAQIKGKWQEVGEKQTGTDGRAVFEQLPAAIYQVEAHWGKQTLSSKPFETEAPPAPGRALLLAFKTEKEPISSPQKKDVPSQQNSSAAEVPHPHVHESEALEKEEIYMSGDSFIGIDIKETMDGPSLWVQQNWFFLSSMGPLSKEPETSFVLPLPAGAYNIQLAEENRATWTVQHLEKTKLSSINAVLRVPAKGLSLLVSYQLPCKDPWTFKQWLPFAWQGVRVVVVQRKKGIRLEGPGWVVTTLNDPFQGLSVTHARSGTWLPGTQLEFTLHGLPVRSRWIEVAAAAFASALLVLLVAWALIQRRKRDHSAMNLLLQKREALLKDYEEIEQDPTDPQFLSKKEALKNELAALYKKLDEEAK